MKLGVSYNLFDGEELLESSINQIRGYVDYISVVYQLKSNYGNSCDSNLLEKLEYLKSKNLIDFMIEYTPNLSLGPHQNEIEKRNFGLMLSKANGCTHHMSMDTDEFYVKEQFEFLKKTMSEGDYDSSYCKMISYYKSGEYIRIPLEDYYVSLIYKINNNSKFILDCPSPVVLDATRRIISLNPIIFERSEIEMHHFSMVRNNIRSKFINSSAKVLFNDKIEDMVYYYNNWEFPKKALWPGKPPYLVEIKKVENKFL